MASLVIQGSPGHQEHKLRLLGCKYEKPTHPAGSGKPRWLIDRQNSELTAWAGLWRGGVSRLGLRQGRGFEKCGPALSRLVLADFSGALLHISGPQVGGLAAWWPHWAPSPVWCPPDCQPQGLALGSPCGAHLPAGWLRLVQVVASSSQHRKQTSLCCSCPLVKASPLAKPRDCVRAPKGKDPERGNTRSLFKNIFF